MELIQYSNLIRSVLQIKRIGNSKTNNPEGVNVSHDVMPPRGFLFGGHFEVDVVDLRLQFLDLKHNI
jgi:hypothetical protein